MSTDRARPVRMSSEILTRVVSVFPQPTPCSMKSANESFILMYESAISWCLYRAIKCHHLQMSGFASNATMYR